MGRSGAGCRGARVLGARVLGAEVLGAEVLGAGARCSGARVPGCWRAANIRRVPRPHPALSFGRPQVFAHRGGAALRPENTLLAFDHGMSLGADGLEFDVHLSRDGVVVVHHDPTLERTTSGRGPLAALTADELARLDAGYWFAPLSGPPSPAGSSPATSGHAAEHPFRGMAGGVPRLADVLRRYPTATCIIELKVNEPALAHRTIDVV